VDLLMRKRLCGKAAGGLIVAAALATALPATSRAEPARQRASMLPGSFVYLRDVDPTIIQDIRYATTNNFTGRRLAGYEAGECILRREAAAALARVQQDLKSRGLSLKVFDCYRPARASRDMLAWATGAETPMQKRYYPKLNKRDLFALGYIAASSGHSTGAAIDLTLVELTADNKAGFDPAASYADCTAPAEKRAPENSVDMGSGFDCFDGSSHTAARSITLQQRDWRQTLVTAMRRQGFVNYSKEWWHFSLPGAGRGAFDFPIAGCKSPQ
jgi:zinc D-Ala-D-Ala dipeptidase